MIAFVNGFDLSVQFDYKPAKSLIMFLIRYILVIREIAVYSYQALPDKLLNTLKQLICMVRFSKAKSYAAIEILVLAVVILSSCRVSTVVVIEKRKKKNKALYATRKKKK